MSQDGGAPLAPDPPRGGGDTHDIWIDPTDGRRFMVADDGGATITLNRGRSFERVVLPIAQMYHVFTDNEIPYNVYGNRQDGWSYWEVISPDLTLNDKSKQRSSGGMTTDNLMTFDGSVLYALAESPLEEGLLWSGSNDGQTRISRDAGRTWQNVTANLPELPPYGQFSNIEPSRHDPATAYAAVDLHQTGNFDPYLYKTADYGASWVRVDGGIERSPFSFVHVVKEDPVRPGTLFIGTDNAVWFTLDDGAHWMMLRNNLPAAPVYWLTVQPYFHDLVVGTYGRGIWIPDNITGLRGLDSEVMAQEATALPVLPAYRFLPVQGLKSTPSHVRGQDPPFGASVDVWLSDATAHPMEVEIVDGEGNVIRALEQQGRPGLNRIQWDLRYEAPRAPRLRTPPPDMPWIEMEQDGTRRLRTWDLNLVGGQVGPLVVPGAYTARVCVAGQTLETPVTVLKDPSSTGSVEEIRRQVALALALRDDLDEMGRMIDRMEGIREQVEDLRDLTRVEVDAEAVAEAAETFRAQLLDVEGRLFDVHLSGAREDAFRAPMKLYGRMASLGSDVSRFGADLAPTVQQREVYEVLNERFEEAKRLMDRLLAVDLPALNERLRALDMPVISD